MDYNFEITLAVIENGEIVRGVARWKSAHAEHSALFLKPTVLEEHTLQYAIKKFLQERRKENERL